MSYNVLRYYSILLALGYSIYACINSITNTWAPVSVWLYMLAYTNFTTFTAISADARRTLTVRASDSPYSSMNLRTEIKGVVLAVVCAFVLAVVLAEILYVIPVGLI